MRCARFPISYAVLRDFFRLRVFGAPGSTVVPSHGSPADLAGKYKLVVVAGLRMWESHTAISKPGFSQASSAGQGRWAIVFARGEHGPGHTCQLIGQRHTGDVVVGTRC